MNAKQNLPESGYIPSRFARIGRYPLWYKTSLV